MNAYERAVIHEAIERIAEAREKLAQQEQELQLMLDTTEIPKAEIGIVPQMDELARNLLRIPRAI